MSPLIETEAGWRCPETAARIQAQLDNPNVDTAISMAHKYRLSDKQMDQLAWYLCKESTAGRIKHNEHRKMVAVKWCKAQPK